jgi:uncharacterized protein
MALKQNQENELIGRGWSFPVGPGEKGRMELLNGVEKVRQSIWLLLSTAPGERVMLPDYGCGIHDLVFEANSASLRGQIQAEVRAALTRWEPRIDVMDVRAENAPGMPTQLIIRIDYRLRADNSLYNLVYPFFLKEGAG